MTTFNDFMEELLQEAKIEGAKAVEEIKLLRDFFRDELKRIMPDKDVRPVRGSMPGTITSPRLAVAQAQFDKEELKWITQYIEQHPVAFASAKFSELVSEYLKHHTVRELAEMVNVSHTTVRRWASADSIPHKAIQPTIIRCINEVRTKEKW